MLSLTQCATDPKNEDDPDLKRGVALIGNAGSYISAKFYGRFAETANKKPAVLGLKWV